MSSGATHKRDMEYYNLDYLWIKIGLPMKIGNMRSYGKMTTPGNNTKSTSDAYFKVTGGNPLFGEFVVQGAKNAVLKQMAATLLASGEHHLFNVPRILDVEIMSDLLQSMGLICSWEESHHLVIITPEPDHIRPFADYELVERIRASVTVLGPLLARLRYATISMPGGDDFGHRPIDIHLNALRELGATFTISHGYVEGKVGRLVGTTLELEFPSHTATDNVMMAATLAEGTTIVRNAAREPEIIDLGMMLNSMGGRISGLGTSTLIIEGVTELRPAEYRIISDRIDAATVITAVGMNKGDVFVRHGIVRHMDMLLRKLKTTGLEFVPDNQGFRVRCSQRLDATDIATLPYPGIATDYLPLLVAALSTANGNSIVTENLFSGRFKYVDELRRLGASMTTHGHHVAIQGVATLQGAPVKATDIRAGAALLVAATAADGETRVLGTTHIQRGYEDLATRLGDLGAKISFISD